VTTCQGQAVPPQLVPCGQHTQPTLWLLETVVQHPSHSGAHDTVMPQLLTRSFLFGPTSTQYPLLFVMSWQLVARGSGVQQPFGPALPPPQTCVEPQALGQVTEFPQLSVAGPHDFPAQVVVRGGGVQPQTPAVAPPPQVCGAGQGASVGA